jgi:hypothetical protein
MRRAPYVMHTVLAHLAHERCLPAPTHILPAVVRQHLTRRPIGAYAAPVYLQHVRGSLTMEDFQARDVPRMVVNEPNEIGVRSKQFELKDIALPHLVRRRALEKARLRRIARRLLFRRLEQPLPVQRAPHRFPAHRQKQHPLQKMRHPLHTIFRMLALGCNDSAVNARVRLRSARMLRAL